MIFSIFGFIMGRMKQYRILSLARVMAIDIAYCYFVTYAEPQMGPALRGRSAVIPVEAMAEIKRQSGADIYVV